MTTETRPGKFIVIEGNDGAGKTTQVGRLAQYLKEQGIAVIPTKQPGGIKETEPLRKLILNPRLAEDGMGQLLLFTADRKAHLVLQILPALNEGKVIVCDRFSGSTIVYQHHDRGVPLWKVLMLDREARTQNRTEIKPNLIILLDVDPKIGMSRRKGQKLNYFDEDGLARQARRRDGYLELARKEGWVVVNANQTEEEVFGQILEAIKRLNILPKEEND